MLLHTFMLHVPKSQTQTVTMLRNMKLEEQCHMAQLHSEEQFWLNPTLSSV